MSATEAATKATEKAVAAAAARKSIAAAAGLCYRDLTLPELTQWLELHPGHSNDWDHLGMTALSYACYTVYSKQTVTAHDLVLLHWIIDIMGADVNLPAKNGCVALHYAGAPLLTRMLLERRADPTAANLRGETVLMTHIDEYPDECVAILLADPRVVATINQGMNEESDWPGFTALHVMAQARRPKRVTAMRLLMRAGADPYAKDVEGDTPMEAFREFAHYYQEDGNKMQMAVLEEGRDALRAAALLRLRRLVVVREKQGVGVEVQEEVKMEVEKEGGESGGNKEEEEAKWKRTLAFVLGLDGQQGCLLFTLVMDFLVPVWHPLRKPLGGYREVGEVGDEDEERVSMPINCGSKCCNKKK